MAIEAIGRRLRLGVIGGGAGSVIGQVHRSAVSLDGYYDIVASVLSSDPERSRQSGLAIGISKQRSYASWQELILEESRRDDGIDVIAVESDRTATTRTSAASRGNPPCPQRWIGAKPVSPCRR
jgi:predicted dehydrogenase